MLECGRDLGRMLECGRDLERMPEFGTALDKAKLERRQAHHI